MKQRKFFQSEEKAKAFAEGLRAASDGHIHSTCIGLSTSAHLKANPYWVGWIDENKKAAELPEKCPPLTPQEYVAHKGAICPVCQGSGLGVNISSGVFDNESASIKVHCNNPDCEASWTDCYELSGYDNLET